MAGLIIDWHALVTMQSRLALFLDQLEQNLEQDKIMGKLEKLIKKLLRDPPELSYDEVYYILTNFGFEEVSAKGSHHTFRNQEGQKITVPKKGGKIVKRTYLKQIVILLKLGK